LTLRDGGASSVECVERGSSGDGIRLYELLGYRTVMETPMWLVGMAGGSAHCPMPAQASCNVQLAIETALLMRVSLCMSHACHRVVNTVIHHDDRHLGECDDVMGSEREEERWLGLRFMGLGGSGARR
jgi:hypothetical protein